jgi:hypothetical protein
MVNYDPKTFIVQANGLITPNWSIYLVSHLLSRPGGNVIKLLTTIYCYFMLMPSFRVTKL